VIAGAQHGRGGERWKVFMKLWILVSALATSLLPLRASAILAMLEVDKPFLEARQIRDEVDPTDQQACESMGQLTLIYESGEVGPPNVGLQITDPRGRKIGYDLRANKGWQELPLAQGFFDCDEIEDTAEPKHCTGHIQICGPISGTYKVEVLPAKTGKYSISLSSISQATRDHLGYHSTASRLQLKSQIHNLAPEILLLEYYREAGAQIKLTRSDQALAAGRKTEPKSLRIRDVVTTENASRSSQ
jgi:hypothetical protein